ncbi:hypothetical protein [Chitinophaga pinensis]|uniref:hypothetical protein n=1 Tax=Chitinophaga pinensis TaxID=79329 RepID=UPI0021BCFFF0|nr:hypothetical protein [Chitinophaga pinensis]
MIIDNLIAVKQAKPMLVVMMDGNVSRGSFDEESLRTFENELMQVVVPFIEKGIVQLQMRTKERWQACLWVAYKHFTPVSGILINLLIWVCSAPVGLAVSNSLLNNNTLL